MRVIAGTAKGRRLKSVPGDTTRPILDRVKESLFNIVSEQTVGTHWLDLFAGTGQVGIEALSRGAGHVVFVDMAKAAVTTISGNLKLCKITEGARVIRSDSFAILDQIHSGRWRGELFDYVFVAPPQYEGLWLKALLVIDSAPDQFLTEFGEVIVQIDPKEMRDTEEAEGWPLANLVKIDERKYGRTLIQFYARPDDETTEETGAEIEREADGDEA